VKSGIFAKTLLAGSLAIGVLTMSGFAPSTDAPTPRRIEIVASKFRYSPDEITLKKGEPVILVLTTQDVNHGLSFKGLNLNAKIEKGKPTELPFTPNKVGDFVGHCSVFCGSGHGSMQMTIHVTE
jgi:cytochrome c oxidase subunit II